MRKGLTPGTRAPISAQYGVLGPRGGWTGREVQSEKGNPLPPTSRPGETYIPVDPVKNQSGRA